MYPFNYYLGCYSNDQLNNIIKYIKKNDLKKFCFIINSLNSKDYKKLGHWIAVYGDFNEDLSLEYFDSYGNKPNKEFKNKFKKLLEDMQIEHYVKFKYNAVKIQSDNSSSCGWIAIKFLMERLHNIPFDHASQYKKIKDSEKDVLLMKKFMIKFKFI